MVSSIKNQYATNIIANFEMYNQSQLELVQVHISTNIGGSSPDHYQECERQKRKKSEEVSVPLVPT